LVIFLVLGLIILVAAFSIVSALTMVILQKHDSIAMLRAMGATASHIRLAFVQMGAAIGLIGTTAGGLLGVATCTLIEQLGIQLPEAYYVRTLPVDMQIAEISAVVVAAIAVSLVATVFPATSAARLAPLEGLRHG
jgi:lipoprotein-releasing system permease protein